MAEDSSNGVNLEDISLDVEDSYADIDLSRLPEWWREAIKEFESHGIRRYMPPRFQDDVLIFSVVEQLEQEYDVEIDFVGKNVAPGDDWTVRVDHDPVGTIGRRRAPEAYTVFEMDSDEFEEWIRNRLSDR